MNYFEKYTSYRPNFFPRPMFSSVRNAMKLSFVFYDRSNYLKIQNGRHLGQNWCFETLIREALYFCGSYKLTGQLITCYIIVHHICEKQLVIKKVRF